MYYFTNPKPRYNVFRLTEFIFCLFSFILVLLIAPLVNCLGPQIALLTIIVPFTFITLLDIISTVISYPIFWTTWLIVAIAAFIALFTCSAIIFWQQTHFLTILAGLLFLATAIVYLLDCVYIIWHIMHKEEPVRKKRLSIRARRLTRKDRQSRMQSVVMKIEKEQPKPEMKEEVKVEQPVIVEVGSYCGICPNDAKDEPKMCSSQSLQPKYSSTCCRQRLPTKIAPLLTSPPKSLPNIPLVSPPQPPRAPLTTTPTTQSIGIQFDSNESKGVQASDRSIREASEERPSRRGSSEERPRRRTSEERHRRRSSEDRGRRRTSQGGRFRRRSSEGGHGSRRRSTERDSPRRRRSSKDKSVSGSDPRRRSGSDSRKSTIRKSLAALGMNIIAPQRKDRKWTITKDALDNDFLSKLGAKMDKKFNVEVPGTRKSTQEKSPQESKQVSIIKGPSQKRERKVSISDNAMERRISLTKRPSQDEYTLNVPVKSADVESKPSTSHSDESDLFNMPRKIIMLPKIKSSSADPAGPKAKKPPPSKEDKKEDDDGRKTV